MAEDIQAAIAQAIEQNLPAQVGDALKKRLRLLETLEHDVTQLREELEIAQTLLVDSEADQERLNQLDQMLLAVEERERNVQKREDIVTLIETHAKVRVDDMKELVSTVFKGPASRVAFDFSASGVNPGRMNAQGYHDSDTFPSVSGSATVEKSDG